MFASVSKSAASGLSRRRAGRSDGVDANCAPISAPALTKTQRSPSPLAASAAVVRDGILLARAESQFGHPQFHCGSPPPAALPRATIRMMRCGKCMSHSVAVAHALWTGPPSDGRPLSVVPQIRRHLGAQGDHREVGLLPRLHGDPLLRASSSGELKARFLFIVRSFLWKGNPNLPRENPVPAWA